MIPVIDSHNDTILASIVQGRRISGESSRGHVDIPRIRSAGMIAGVFALCPTRYGFLMRLFASTWLRVVNDPGNDLVQVFTVDDIERATKQGKIGAIMSFEGAGGFDKHLSMLEYFARKGLRQLNITWSNKNKFGTGVVVNGPQDPDGLTDLGRELVGKAQSLGVTIDVSHLNDRSFWDVMEVAEKPVIASHSNCRAICPHVRNLDDEQIRAIGEKHGAIGINLGTKFLDPEYVKGKKDQGFDLVKRHVDHIVELAGIDTVALGADFDGTTVPDVIGDVRGYPPLLDYLLENGYSEQDVRKIASENLLRVYKETW